MLGGQVGIADNLTLGAGVKVAAKSGIMENVPAGEEMWGLPARPRREAIRDYATLLKLLEEQRAQRADRKKAQRENPTT
jgi:UDP-3-O-[3-hydroxymyristoyl] glucosamine N-acyltransferase